MVNELKRSEILFLYDVKDANPNGDPLDENKPRIDEETRINIVTDVRLKRTIRDYLKKFKSKELFVTERRDDEGKLFDAKTTANEYGRDKKEIENAVKSKCIDIRLFGATIPLGNEDEKGDSIKLTGPVQFKMGRSLNKVELKHIKGTGAFASGYKKKKMSQQTFREEYVVPYSLIAFSGIINEHGKDETGLTLDDVNFLLEAIWKGTDNLISRSKFGQKSRLLLLVQYKEPNFFIGDLDKMVRMDKNNENVRDVSEYNLDITELVRTLNCCSKVEKVYFMKDSRVNLVSDNQQFDFGSDTLFEEIKFD